MFTVADLKHGEPTLKEVMNDDITRLVMRSDNVSLLHLESLSNMTAEALSRRKSARAL